MAGKFSLLVHHSTVSCLDPSLDEALHENDIAALRRLAFSSGGYGKIEIRQKVWPVLIAANSSLRLLENNGSI